MAPQKPCKYFDPRTGQPIGQHPRHNGPCYFVHPNTGEWRESIAYYHPAFAHTSEASGRDMHTRDHGRDREYNRDRDRERDISRERDRDSGMRGRPRHAEGSMGSSSHRSASPPPRRSSRDHDRPTSPRHRNSISFQKSPRRSSPPPRRGSLQAKSTVDPTPQTRAAATPPAGSPVVKPPPSSPTAAQNVHPDPPASPSAQPTPTSDRPPATDVSLPGPAPTAPASAMPPPVQTPIAGSTSQTISSIIDAPASGNAPGKATTMSILSSIIGGQAPTPNPTSALASASALPSTLPAAATPPLAPSQPLAGPEEQRRRWNERISLIHRSTEAQRRLQEAEQDLLLRQKLRDKNFTRRGLADQARIGDALRKKEAEVEQQRTEYDTLLRELATAEFWPVPVQGLSDKDREHTARRQIAQLASAINKLKHQSTGDTSPTLGIARDDSDMDIEEDGPPAAAAPAAPAVAALDEAALERILEEVATTLAEQMDQRFEEFDQACSQKFAGVQDIVDMDSRRQSGLQRLEQRLENDVGNAMEYTDDQLAIMRHDLGSGMEQLQNKVSAIGTTFSTSEEVQKLVEKHANDQRQQLESKSTEILEVTRRELEIERAARTQHETTSKELNQRNEGLLQQNTALETEIQRLTTENMMITKQFKMLATAMEQMQRQQSSTMERLAAMEQADLVRQATSPPQPTEFIPQIHEAVMKSITPVLEQQVRHVDQRLREFEGELSAQVLGKMQVFNAMLPVLAQNLPQQRGANGRSAPVVPTPRPA